MSLLERRMMMAAMEIEENEMIKTGYFEIENIVYPGTEKYQVSDTSHVIEVDTGLISAPQKILCIYIDEMQTESDGTSIFSGYPGGNGYFYKKTNGTFKYEAVDFKSTDAQYTRFDETTGKIYLHVRQWTHLKAGKWMWIAIYPE